jgi:hypothetical protein
MGEGIVEIFLSCLLWMLSIAGVVAVLLSWIYVESEYDEEGALTSSSRCSVRARALLTLSCIVFCVCTILGYAFGNSHGLFLGWWQNHPTLLLASFYVADLLLIPSVAFSSKARGSGRWILWIATPILALASTATSVILSMP